MTDVLVKKDIDQSKLFKNQREPKSKSRRRLYGEWNIIAKNENIHFFQFWLPSSCKWRGWLSSPTLVKNRRWCENPILEWETFISFQPSESAWILRNAMLSISKISVIIMNIILVDEREIFRIYYKHIYN